VETLSLHELNGEVLLSVLRDGTLSEFRLQAESAAPGEKKVDEP
jgi:hypothetical protein